MALALGVVLGLSSITFLVASTAIVQMRSAAEMRGRVLALQAMLSLAARRWAAPSSAGWPKRWAPATALGSARSAVGAGLWGLPRCGARMPAPCPPTASPVSRTPRPTPAVTGAVLDPSVTASGLAPVAGGEGPAQGGLTRTLRVW